MIPRVLGPFCTENRPEAPGFRALLVSILLFWLLQSVACTPVTPSREAPGPSGPPIPSIVSGDLSRGDRNLAVGLLRQAQDSLAAGSLEAALEASSRVVREFPALAGSGRALWIQAQALFGLARWAEAADAGERLADLLEAQHSLFPSVSLLVARSLQGAGEGTQALDALLSLPPATPDSVLAPGKDLLRELVPVLSFRDLSQQTQALAPNHPLRGIMATELAVALYLRGDRGEAVRWARSALLNDLDPREEELAEAVVDGRLEETLGRPVIVGVVIPRTGVSPGLAQYGEWFHEGVQVALAVYQDSLPRPIQLEVLDDRGTPLGARTAVRSLEDVGAMAALGFMRQEVLAEGAGARESGMPLLSPFSFLPPQEAPSVYSLSGPDLGEAVQLARMARELELGTVAIVRPRTAEAELNGEAFREEFEALGGIVPREIVFDSAGTFFQPQFQEVEEVLPDGMFLPLKPRDIQLLAPQVTFYGIDTLGVQILGTSGWTDPAVVQGVESRHTDGVVAATARLSQNETESFRRFREAYEDFFHKTLRSEVPAFGYDAAALVLDALMARPRNPRELVAALEEIRDLPGVTGVLRVQDGRISRAPLVVRIQDHELIYITR